MHALVFASLLVAQGTPPASAPAASLLERKFTSGETLHYSVRSLLTVEERAQGLNTFLPRDYGFEYDYTMKVNSVDQDGNAQVAYNRPKTVYVEGEFAERPERRTNQQGGGFKLNLRISPINELIGVEEVKQPSRTSGRALRYMAQEEPPPRITEALAGQFTSELMRIALMTGSLDNSMDFAPPLSFKPVRVGGSWKKTVGYTPQRLGSGSEQGVRRLDFTYTYRGIVDSNGKKVHRIEGAVSQDSDIWPFLLQQYGLEKKDTPFESLILKFDSKLEFDLDLKTLHTVRARAESRGSTKLSLRAGNQAVEEMQFFGENQLTLQKITR